MVLFSVVTLIILLNVLVSLKGFKDLVFFDRFKFNIAGINRGEKLRLVSSGFLHVDMTHLLFNMFTLYMFSEAVVQYLGASTYTFIYFLSLIFGNVFSYYAHRKNSYYSAVGASGAVAGIIYASILLYPEMKLMFILFPVPIPGYIFGVGYLLYAIYGMKKNIGNIGHSAHFGGAVSGFLATILFEPNVMDTQPLVVGLLLIPIIWYGITFKKAI